MKANTNTNAKGDVTDIVNTTNTMSTMSTMNITNITNITNTMNINLNNKKWGAWKQYSILLFLLVFVLSSCSLRQQNAHKELPQQNAYKEKKRLEMEKGDVSFNSLKENMYFAVEGLKHFNVEDLKPLTVKHSNHSVVEKLNHSVVKELNRSLSTPFSAEMTNNKAAQKNKNSKKSANYSVSKLKPYYYPECTISIKDELIQSQEDKRIFHTAFMSHIYYLGEAESLETLDTGLFFKTVVEKFEETRDSKIVERSNQLNRESSRDGVRYDVGYFKTYIDGKATYVSLVMVPQKNMLITHILSFGHVEPEKKSVLEELELMHRNIIFHRGNGDYVSGNTFLVGRNSKLSLQDDGTFKFYRSQHDHKHDYYEGEYEVFYGEEAFEKLTSMPHYDIKRRDLEEELEKYMSEGISLEKNAPIEYLSAHKKEVEEEIEREMEKKYTVCKDTFYAIVLHNKALVTSPSQKEKMTHDTLYVGYYIEEEKTLSLLNANAGSSAIWKFMKKSEKEK